MTFFSTPSLGDWEAKNKEEVGAYVCCCLFVGGGKSLTYVHNFYAIAQTDKLSIYFSPEQNYGNCCVCFSWI